MSLASASSNSIEITPSQAWKILSETGTAKLIDVRTEPEWTYVGVPVLDAVGKSVIRNAWHLFPEMNVNAAFVRSLRAAVNADDVLIFICRSGGRSLLAAKAAMAEGFRACYSVAGGFEGVVDASGHRGMVEGWKREGLPWRQT
jgi:rhodanese-related sulfurtransferase